MSIRLPAFLCISVQCSFCTVLVLQNSIAETPHAQDPTPNSSASNANTFMGHSTSVPGSSISSLLPVTFAHPLSMKLDDNFLLWSQQVQEINIEHKIHRLIVNPLIMANMLQK